MIMSWLALAPLLLLTQPAPQLDITFKTVNQTELKADFYPAKSAESGPKPFVVVIHGGAWIQGKRQDMASTCMALAQQGFSSATVQYRLAKPDSLWPAQLEDVQDAVRFFRSNAQKYDIRTEKIAAMGASAGGHLALLLGMKDAGSGPAPVSTKVQAVVNLFGPTDLTQDYQPFLVQLVARQVLGKAPEDAAEPMKLFSPVNLVTKDSAPVFTIHGTADAVVPVIQANRLDEALKRAGVEHTMKIIQDMGHEDPTKKPGGPEALAEAIAFLNKHLRKPS